MSITSFEAAKKVCSLSNWTATNLVLHKVLYLSHMIYAGRNHVPLINNNEAFEAWAYGPVLPRLYHEVKIFGINPIEDIFYWNDLPDCEESGFLEEACSHFLNKTPAHLVGMTHRANGAWAKNYSSKVRFKKIPFEDIMEEYEKINA